MHEIPFKILMSKEEQQQLFFDVKLYKYCRYQNYIDIDSKILCFAFVFFGQLSHIIEMNWQCCSEKFFILRIITKTTLFILLHYIIYTFCRWQQFEDTYLSWMHFIFNVISSHTKKSVCYLCTPISSSLILFSFFFSIFL